MQEEEALVPLQYQLLHRTRLQLQLQPVTRQSSTQSTMSSPKREAIIHTEFQIVLTSPVAAYTLADVKRAGAELARMHLRLGTNAAYFRSQISRLYSIKEFIDGSNRRPQLRQALLQDSMRLLQQLLQIAAACVQQLSRQVSSLDAGNAILAPASMFCASILENLSLVTQPIDAMTSGPSMMVNRQVLGLLQDTGDKNILLTLNAAATSKVSGTAHFLLSSVCHTCNC